MIISIDDCIIVSSTNLSLILQTGKSTFVEHRSFLHLYRSFHRLWIFLVLMFQVGFLSISTFLLMLHAVCSSLSGNFIDSYWLQGLSIIAFRKGNINLDTFKILLSLGPTFAIMNFIESKLLALLTCICN